MDVVGHHFADTLIDEIKAGKKLQGVGDNCKNITPEKVTKSHKGSEQFLLSVGKAYLLEAAMIFWGMEKLEDQPTKYVPPSGIAHMTKRKKNISISLLGNL